MYRMWRGYKNPYETPMASMGIPMGGSNISIGIYKAVS